MGKRGRRRTRTGKGASTEPSSSTAYAVDEGNVLVLRDDLSPGTVKGLDKLDARPAADAEDRWQRRMEYLFERLAVRWEISGLPLEGQRELLGRYRMASSEERRQVREVLVRHLHGKRPDIDL